ncbi:MAG TPA: STAS domain-containing protein [Armatimonadota bacterium]|nr:STAS domain-containing protein [Armatimonadota bacterium]
MSVSEGFSLERLPGEAGPVVRCSGELTRATVPVLQHELDRLEPMQHDVITLNLSGLSFVDVDGIMLLLDACRRRQEAGFRLVFVAAPGEASHLLHTLGIDWLIPVFPSEHVAALALRGGGPPQPAPATWEEARRKTLERWDTVRSILKAGPPEKALRILTGMFGLCERSEAEFGEHGEQAHSRCQFCPLYEALGGEPRHTGCRSVLDPIIDAVQAGDTAAADRKICDLMDLIRSMPLPDQQSFPSMQAAGPAARP